MASVTSSLGWPPSLAPSPGTGRPSLAAIAVNQQLLQPWRRRWRARSGRPCSQWGRIRTIKKNLITSLFPNIHGNNEVKHGIMLMMFGRVVRGNINVCVEVPVHQDGGGLHPVICLQFWQGLLHWQYDSRCGQGWGERQVRSLASGFEQTDQKHNICLTCVLTLHTKPFQLS